MQRDDENKTQISNTNLTPQESNKSKDKEANQSKTTNAAKGQANTQQDNKSPISLPKGGGAIQSIGEKFQANPMTGTGNLSVPINMSQGRAEFTPQIGLSYDSGSGNSPFGLGWSVGLPQITRKTQKELPKYHDINTHPAKTTRQKDAEDTFIISGAEDLVPVLEESGNDWVRKVRKEADYIITSYRPRIEGLFAKIERWYDTQTKLSHWRSTSKENITSVFGLTENARIADPNKPTKIFKWLIEQSYDAKGNAILYTYKKENADNIVNTVFEKNRLLNQNAFTQSYLQSVHYANKIPLDATHDFNAVNTAGWHLSLFFDYGEYADNNDGIPQLPPQNTWTQRPDAFSVYSAGFEIRTYRLCKRILMYHDFDTQFTGFVKTTKLSYNHNAIATQLTAVTHQFIKQNELANMPALDFMYSEASIDKQLYSIKIKDLINIPQGFDNNAVQLIDLQATGLPGILIEDQNAWYFKENLGNIDYYGTPNRNSREDTDKITPVGGESTGFAKIRKLAQKPNLAHISGQNQGLRGTLTDIDGDGIAELMIFAPPFAGYFKQKTTKNNDDEPEWQGFVPFKSIPNVNMGDPNLKTIDITGDGTPDLLITEQNTFLCYPSDEENGWKKAFRVSKALEAEKGPALVFDDGVQSIYLADMSGDGLTDIVRINNGSIVYWANLGYGRFSQKISMSNAPHFDYPDKFNQNRIRIADIDGSGTSDLIYLGDSRISYWFNQSGNAFSETMYIDNFPKTDNLANVFVTDLLGSGTSCIVWSSALQKDKPYHIKYIDLMSGNKPYLLIETDNNMGAQNRYRYAASTKFYLKHKKEGRPWQTKLPFPVQVLERTETYDAISNTRFVTLYEYHNGFYDGYEREFRGFGMVEQRDTEKYENFAQTDLFEAGNNADETSHIPPVLTKSWFHLGVHTPLHDRLTANVKSIQEKREAQRALKGSLLKQEVYAEDTTDIENLPYLTTEKKYELKCLQKLHTNKHAVFFVTELQTQTRQSERLLDDAVYTQSINLETDTYGNVLKSVQIAYPRGFKSLNPPTDSEPEQEQVFISFTQSDFINEDNNTNFYLIGVPYQTQAYELTGLAVEADFFTKETVIQAIDGATAIPFEQSPNLVSLEKRLLSKTKILYHQETPDIDTPLAPGVIASHALPYQTFKAAFSDNLLHTIYGDANTANPILKTGENISSLIQDAKYIKGNSIFTGSDFFDDDLWYAPSEKIEFNKNKFYLPEKTYDLFGNPPTVITYDNYSLLPLKVTDALANEIVAENNYRLLQTQKITDINDNTQEVVFDTRGMVIKNIIKGKNGEGDTLDKPGLFLEYKLFNWQNNQKPNYVKTTARIWHAQQTALYGSDTDSLISYTYTTGLGQELMTKVQAEDGELNGVFTNNRWVGTGRVVVNNKGKLVKQYEPYFSDTFEYETEADMPAYGVTPLFYYDSLGRNIKTEMPDGTFTKVQFTPWQIKKYDPNDTILESQWLRDLFPGWDADPATLPAINGLTGTERAAILSVSHAETPQIVKNDALGRAFLIIDDNQTVQYSQRNKLDILGNLYQVIDAKGRLMTTHHYDMLGRPLKTYNIDSGTRKSISDASDKPYRQSDSRGHILSFSYDALQRPTQTQCLASPQQTAVITLLKTNYGTDKTKNQNGQITEQFDQSGQTSFEQYDFKGNPLTVKKQFAGEYKNTLDWATYVIASGVEEVTFTNSLIYDALNRPIHQTKPDNSLVKNQFNKAGLLEKIELDHKGQGNFTDYVTNIDYNAKGQRTEIYYANNTKTKYEYNPKNFRLTRLLTTRNNGADILQDLSYIYDPQGNITEVTDNAQQSHYFNGAVVAAKSLYEYDALYRLLKATGRELNNLAMPSHSDFINSKAVPNTDANAMQNYTQEFSYDEIGNILTHKSQGKWTRDYRYNFTNNNYLLDHDLQSNTDTYLYDAHGNMTKMPHLQELKWDFADNLKEVVLDASGNTAYYVYDANGDRVRKVIEKGNIIENRYYIGDYEVYTKTTNGAIDIERETLHLNDDKQKVALIDSKTIENNQPVTPSAVEVRFQYTNHLDSASLELDETGDIISYEEYHPFVTTSYRSGRNQVDVSLKRYKYVHKELDNETGLYYYGARYYASWLGRFVSVDPLQYDYPQLTPYNYAGNKPITYYDIDGMQGNGDIRRNQENDLNYNLKIGLNYSFGTNSQSSVNFSLGFGVSKTNDKGSAMYGANLSLNLSTGGFGSSQVSTGKSSKYGIVTLGLSSTFGNGAGTPTDLNIFTSRTLTGVTNTFDKSFTIGTTLSLDNSTGFNRAWGITGKLGGVTLTVNEDFSWLTGGEKWYNSLPAGFGILSSGFDEGNTGGGFLSYTNKFGSSVTFGAEIFTGKPTTYPKKEDSNNKGYVLQTSSQKEYNVGTYFFEFKNFQDIGNLRIDFQGNGLGPQDFIHNTLNYDLFIDNAIPSIIITK